jgi:serine/threonine-protein kinase
MFAHLHDPVPLPSEKVPGLSPAFDTLVARAMAKDPAERPDSCNALLEDARRSLPAPRATTTVLSPSPTAEMPTRAQAEQNGEPPRPRSLKWPLIAHLVAYTPLWVAGYIAGRAL